MAVYLSIGENYLMDELNKGVRQSFSPPPPTPNYSPFPGNCLFSMKDAACTSVMKDKQGYKNEKQNMFAEAGNKY